jgi:hypothetical protein
MGVENFPGWLRITIILISASKVAKITGMRGDQLLYRF